MATAMEAAVMMAVVSAGEVDWDGGCSPGVGTMLVPLAYLTMAQGEKGARKAGLGQVCAMLLLLMMMAWAA